VSKAYTIGIVVCDGVLTSEVIGPAEVFAIAAQQEWFQGARVLLLGLEPQPTVCTAEGIGLVVDATVVGAPDLDVLLVPGASDMTPLLESEALNEFIRQQEERAEWLGSVCSGAFVLGNAGVLDGNQATTWFGGEGSLQEQFPAINVVHDKPVVVDNRRITANGGVVSYQAALVLLGRLSSARHAQEVYEALQLERLGRWPEIEAMIAAL
jgi:transcriptional regulator GlxA family with amidase domain